MLQMQYGPSIPHCIRVAVMLPNPSALAFDAIKLHNISSGQHANISRHILMRVQTKQKKALLSPTGAILLSHCQSLLSDVLTVSNLDHRWIIMQPLTVAVPDRREIALVSAGNVTHHAMHI